MLKQNEITTLLVSENSSKFILTKVTEWTGLSFLIICWRGPGSSANLAKNAIIIFFTGYAQALPKKSKDRMIKMS